MLDVARWTVRGGVGERSRAVTLHDLLRDTPSTLSTPEAARSALPSRRRGACSYVWLSGGRIKGLVRARRRSGPWTWELAQLFLEADDEPGYVELLDRVCQGVAGSGGQRVFIRLRSDDPLASSYRRFGFTLCTRETLYAGPRPEPLGDDPVLLRSATDADDYDAFRLYNAATPAKVRYVAGMTFEQWRSSKERSPGPAREFVHHRHDQLRGWIRTNLMSATCMIQMMVHPEDEPSADAIIDGALEQTPRAEHVRCLAADHQFYLHSLLARRGFEPAGEYVILARSMGAVAQQRARRAITVAPS